jgi:hypothetical protein
MQTRISKIFFIIIIFFSISKNSHSLETGENLFCYLKKDKNLVAADPHTIIGLFFLDNSRVLFSTYKNNYTTRNDIFDNWKYRINPNLFSGNRAINLNEHFYIDVGNFEAVWAINLTFEPKKQTYFHCQRNEKLSDINVFNKNFTKLLIDKINSLEKKNKLVGKLLITKKQFNDYAYEYYFYTNLSGNKILCFSPYTTSSSIKETSNKNKKIVGFHLTNYLNDEEFKYKGGPGKGSIYWIDSSRELQVSEISYDTDYQHVHVRQGGAYFKINRETLKVKMLAISQSEPEWDCEIQNSQFNIEEYFKKLPKN